MQSLGHTGCEPLDPLLPLCLFAPPFLPPLCAFVPRKATARSFRAPFDSDCHLMLSHTVSSGAFSVGSQVSQTCLLKVEVPLTTWAPFSPSHILHPSYTPCRGAHRNHTPGGRPFSPPPPGLALLHSCDEQGALASTPSATSINTHSSIPSWGWRSRSPN